MDSLTSLLGFPIQARFPGSSCLATTSVRLLKSCHSESRCIVIYMCAAFQDRMSAEEHSEGIGSRPHLMAYLQLDWVMKCMQACPMANLNHQLLI